MNVNDPALSRGRILVIEDDPEAAYFAVHVLTTRGQFDVTHTADPAEALGLVGTESWDLVLTDLDVPGMTGLELLDARRQAAPALPVAVITAHASADSRADNRTDYAAVTLRSRADALLQKPVRIDQLIAAATTLVRKGRTARPATL
jgi:CheY-like chemotaxis protein